MSVIPVTYEFELPYLDRGNGDRFPGLVVEVRNPALPDLSVEVRAELDSGAEFSLFQGDIANVIGLELLTGHQFIFRTVNSTSITSRIHPIVLAHPDLGPLSINMRFSIHDIQRNILGRDFFDRIQIGLREHHSVVYLKLEQ